MTRHEVDQFHKYARRAHMTTGLRTRLIPATAAQGFGLALAYAGARFETTEADRATRWLLDRQREHRSLTRGNRYSNPTGTQGGAG